MESNFNNLNVINTLLRWRVHLAVIMLIALVGSTLFSGSWLITPKFKSWAVVYPSNIAPYSEESETEQMYQILQASYVRDRVVEEFDLGKHYEISSEDKYYNSILFHLYNENINISKTPSEALRIEVLDKDPVIAKQIVDLIILSYSEKIDMLHVEKFDEVVNMWQRARTRKLITIDSLEIKLKKLAVEDGLLEYGSQSAEVMKGILGTVEGGATRINHSEVSKLRKSIEAKGGILFLTLETLKQEIILLNHINHEYDVAYTNYDRQFSYTNIIEAPFAADKKSYPVRWLIVALTMFTTLLLALMIIGVIENLRIRKAV